MSHLITIEGKPEVKQKIRNVRQKMLSQENKDKIEEVENRNDVHHKQQGKKYQRRYKYR